MARRTAKNGGKEVKGESGTLLLALAAIIVVAIAALVILNSYAPALPTPTPSPEAIETQATPTPEAAAVESQVALAGGEFIINNSFVEARTAHGFADGMYYDSVSFDNKGESSASFSVLEVIPKSLASNMEEVVLEGYDIDNFEILRDDPVLLVAENLKAGQSVQRTIKFKKGSGSAVIRLIIKEEITPEQLEQLASAVSRVAEIPGMDSFRALVAQDQFNKVWQSKEKVTDKLEAFGICATKIVGSNYKCLETEPSQQPSQAGEAVLAVGSISNINPTTTTSVTIETNGLETPLTLLKGDIMKYSTLTLAKVPGKQNTYEARIAFDGSRMPRRAGVFWDDDLENQIFEIVGILAYSPDGLNKFEIPVSISTDQDPPSSHEDALDNVFTSPRNFSFLQGSTVRKPFVIVNNYPFPLTVEGCGFSRRTPLPAFSATEATLTLGIADFGKELSCEITDGQVIAAQLGAVIQPYDNAIYASNTESGVFQQSLDADSIVPPADRPPEGHDSSLCSDNYCYCESVAAALTSFKQEFEIAANSFAAEFNSPAQYAALYPDFNGIYRRVQILRTASDADQCDLSGLEAPLSDLKLESGKIYVVTISAPLGNEGVDPASETLSKRDVGERWAYATPDGAASDPQAFEQQLGEPEFENETELA